MDGAVGGGDVEEALDGGFVGGGHGSSITGGMFRHVKVSVRLEVNVRSAPR